MTALLALGWLVVVYPDARGAGTGKVSAIEIGPTTTLREIAVALADDELVTDAGVFTLYGRVLGADDQLRRKRVLVTDAMNARELLQRVTTGLGATAVRITIPEGWNRFEIAARLVEWDICERESFVRATEAAELRAALGESAQSAEGYLFPDTYELLDRAPARRVVARLLENGRKRLGKLQRTDADAFDRLRSELGMGVHELVTLASIVEKEAHVPAEQPIIAGVFWNRLRDPSFRPKRLQADPTTAYGCLLHGELPSCAAFDGKRVTRTMTGDPNNPYNTYRRDGLPPGPIGNPGLGALRAVLHPSRHDYFYFVAKGGGRHEFSHDLAAHNAAVLRAAQPAAR